MSNHKTQLLTLKLKIMKKLDSSQMENLQGGVDRIKACYLAAATLALIATPLIAGAVALGCAAADI